MAKWTESTTVQFVEEYLRHEVLWNFRSPNYRNKQAKQQAINAIVATMAIPDFGYKEVDLKIKSIRSTYSQELKKIKNSTASGSGGDDPYKSNLKWFNILDEALKSVNISEIRKTHNNLENKEDRGTEESEATENSEENSCEHVSEDTISKTATAGRKRKLKDLNALVNKLDNVNKAINSEKTAEHEFDLFGKSIAGQLKVLPLLQAVEAQQFIQNYLSQLRITLLRDNSRPSPLPPNRQYSYTSSTSTNSYASPSLISCTPTPINNYTNQPPSPTDNNTNQLLTRPPTPQETITIYSQDSDDILAQALASIKP